MNSKLSAQFTSPRLPFLIIWLAAAAYILAYLSSYSHFFFDFSRVADDAQQMAFPYYSVIDPLVFQNDLLADFKLQYTPILHRVLSFVLTLATGSPIEMTHWLTLVHLLLTGLMIFLLVRHWSSKSAGVLAVVWYLNTTRIADYINGGLPRSWAFLLIVTYLYLLQRGLHKSILCLIAISIALYPPCALIIGLAYGFYISYRWLKDRQEPGGQHLRNFLSLLICSPFYLAFLIFVSDKPDYIGSIVSYQDALLMPELARPGGRFELLPFLNPLAEIGGYLLMPFTNRELKPMTLLPVLALGAIVVSYGLAFLLSIKRARTIISAELLCLALSSLVLYFLARMLAFRLYVPSRYLVYPLAIFVIISLPVLVWRIALNEPKATLAGALKFFLMSLAIAGLVYLNSGANLKGDLGFDAGSGSGVYQWFKTSSDKQSLVAGNPHFIDGVQLFGARRAYVTAECSNPMFSAYYKEISRRLNITWDAYFAKDLKTLHRGLAAEKIDYFVFRNNDFEAKQRLELWTFNPYQEKIRMLASRDSSEYAFSEMGLIENAVFIAYQDSQATVIDIDKLGKHLIDVDANLS